MRHDGRDAASTGEESRTGTTATTTGDEREIVVDGHAWMVREIVHPSTRTPTLVFVSDSVARWVHVYPPNWRVLTNQALYALSWSK